MPADTFNFHKRRREGFSLLELLVTVTVMTIVAASLSRISYQVWQVYKHSRDDGRYARLLQSIDSLTRDLENMTPFSYTLHDQTYFSGNETRLRFAKSTGEGLRIVEYTFEARNDDDHIFDFKRSEFLLHSPDPGAVHIVAENIQGHFQYHLQQEGKSFSASVWEEGWPISVEIYLADEEINMPILTKNIYIPVSP